MIEVLVVFAALVIVTVAGAKFVAKPALVSNKPAPQSAEEVLHGLAAIKGINIGGDIELAKSGKLSMGAYKGILREAAGRCEKPANVPVGPACEIARSEFLRATQD